MKYIVIVGDGMADTPLPELGGRTPLQKANIPNMDALASQGIVGSVRTVPEGMHPGSDVANLSILGYNPNEYYSGRAPLEAASMGIDLAPGDVAFRCNLVTLDFRGSYEKSVMNDYSSGHISSEEAGLLMDSIGKRLGTKDTRFFAGVSYRHLMVWSGGPHDTDCTPPHDILGKEVSPYLPGGEGASVLRELMEKSVPVLSDHPVNRQRVESGKKPANSLWFWGQGGRPAIPLFRQKYGVDGALVSAVDLTKGLGVCAGFRILEVPGITGYIDTNYRGKAEAALRALKDVDFVYIHVEAPDEAGHSGRLEEKIRAIEDIDSLVIGTVREGLRGLNDWRLLILPDHPTPVRLRTHTADPVPFIIAGSGDGGQRGDIKFDEGILSRTGIMIFDEGHRLMDFFIRGEL